MNKVKYFIVFLFTFYGLFAAEDKKAAVYIDDGCWDAGLIAFEKFLEFKNIEYDFINAESVRNGYLTNEKYAFIFISGGDANVYFNNLGMRGINKIRNFVAKGGAYLGICAGAYLASDSVIWQGIEIDAALSLFDGTAVGPLNEIIPWKNYIMTEIAVNRKNQISKYLAGGYSTLYYGGPAFYVHSGAKIDTVATWNSYQNAPAIINFEYKNGRVFLSGPHLEIEENSSRDGITFGEELYEPDSEWDILWAAVDWLMKREVSQMPLDKEEPSADNLSCRVFVANNEIKFYLPDNFATNSEIEIFNINGSKISVATVSQTDNGKIISISRNNMSDGVYFYVIRLNRQSYFGKFLLY